MEEIIGINRINPHTLITVARPLLLGEMTRVVA